MSKVVDFAYHPVVLERVISDEDKYYFALAMQQLEREVRNEARLERERQIIPLRGVKIGSNTG